MGGTPHTDKTKEIEQPEEAPVSHAGAAHATTAVLDRPATKSTSAPTAPAPVQYEDEDFVCFVRLNWGTPAIPPDKIDYVDKYTFTGGICRNVSYKHAKLWLKRKTVHGQIVENEATMADIARIMGRNPESPENIAAAIHTMSPEKILAILGPDQAKELARSILGTQID